MDFEAERLRLVGQLRGEIRDERVLAAMLRVPREKFISERLRESAYDDKPLPIGLEQTISQPLIVAIMTEALNLTGSEKVLELGTGSGYQTAILAELSQSVVSVERLHELSDKAEKILDSLGFTNITLHYTGDALGWPDEAPYDAIITTAGAPRVPQKLVDQLVTGGRLIIPVGSRYSQELYRITRREDKIEMEKLGGCRFVSLIGEDAWAD